MGFLDFFSNMFGGVTDAIQSPIEDAMGGLTENEVVQGLQDQVGSVAEQGQQVVDDVKQNLGL